MMMNKLNKRCIKNRILDQSHLLFSFLLFTLLFLTWFVQTCMVYSVACRFFFLNTFIDAVLTSAVFSKSTPWKKTHLSTSKALSLCFTSVSSHLQPPRSPFCFPRCTLWPYRFSTLSPPVTRLIPRPLMCLFSLFIPRPLPDIFSADLSFSPALFFSSSSSFFIFAQQTEIKILFFRTSACFHLLDAFSLWMNSVFRKRGRSKKKSHHLLLTLTHRLPLILFYSISSTSSSLQLQEYCQTCKNLLQCFGLWVSF